MKRSFYILVVLFGMTKIIYSQNEVIVFINSNHTSSFASEPIKAVPKLKWEFELPAMNCSNPIIVRDMILANSYDEKTIL